MTNVNMPFSDIYKACRNVPSGALNNVEKTTVQPLVNVVNDKSTQKLAKSLLCCISPIFVLLAGIRKPNLISPEIAKFQKGLKSVFGHNYSLMQTVDFLSRYKKIMGIGDDRKWTESLFEELKKDFSVENKKLKLFIMDKPLPVKSSDGVGVFDGYTDALSRYIKTTFINRKKTMGNLVHELMHVKQNELMYRTDGKNLITIKVNELENSNNECWKSILASMDGNRMKAREEVRGIITDIYSTMWGHLKPVARNSSEYNRGVSYLFNEANRVLPGGNYYEQVLEKEARAVENEAVSLFEQAGLIS